MIGTMVMALAAQTGPAPEAPAEAWSVDRIARRAVERSNPVLAREAERDEAAARRDRAFVDVLPRGQLSFDYTRIGDIENDPLVDLGVDLDAVAQDVAGVQDPAAQAALQAQLGVLQGLDGFAIDVPNERAQFSAELRYPVSALFFELLPALRATEHAEAARGLQLKAARNDEALRAVEIYLRHVLAQQALDVARLTEEEAALDRNQAQGQLDAGLATEPELLRFEARVAEAEGEVASREADVIATASSLRALLDLDGAGPLAAVEDVTRPELQRGLSKSAPERPESEAAELLVRARRAEAKATRGGAAPRLGVAAAVDVAQPNALLVPPNTDRFRTTWRLSAGLAWSPDRAAAAWLKGDEARARQRRAEANLAAVEDQIQIEVATAGARRTAATQRLAAAQRQVDAAERALEGRRAAYGEGLADATEVLAAERQLGEARLLRVRAGTQALLEDARLRRALGDPLYD